MSRRKRPQGKWIREDRPITLDEIDWLRSPAGRETMAAMEHEPADAPAAIEKWRQRLDADQVAAAWHQVKLRYKARAKFSRADDMLFDRVGLEQATDEVIARYKAERYVGSASVTDLCCGIGGDALALAEVARVSVIDWSRTRVAMAAHNVAVYGFAVESRVGDVTFGAPESDAIHIDPDRRAEGARRHAAAEASPAIDVVWRIARDAPHAGIKLSPGADFDNLPVDHELELISHKGECRQAMVWTGRLAEARRSATALPGGERIEARDSDDLAWPEAAAVRPECYLYEPDAAVIRADLVGLLARRHGLAPVDAQIAWLTGNAHIKSDLLAAFRVIDARPWSARQARAWLNAHNIGVVDIKTRGFAARPEDIRGDLKLKGTQKGVLFLTRAAEGPIAILAERA